MTLSTKRAIAYAPLETLMYKSLEEQWGLKVRVLSNEALFKRAFYELRKEFPEFKTLSLITTTVPQTFLIYHPEQGESNEQE